MPKSIHICRFDTTEDLKTAQLTYANVKKRVLETGKFSIFEATSTNKRAQIFTDLSRDPELLVEPMAYPWTSVKRKSESR